MEYQGIVTGIGNQDNNVIMPEVDAVINAFIIGKNTIIEGLRLNDKKLSAGTCILCGYRGILNVEKELDTTNYVYGKFVLNFDKEIVDTFEIETTTVGKTDNVNPTSITRAGTYYLLLYEYGKISEDLDTEYPYPDYAKYSEETKKVLDGGEIESEVTGVTQLPNDNSNRIATTQYVHNQIEEEIDYDEKTIPIQAKDINNNNRTLGKIKFQKKSRNVVAFVQIGEYSGTLGIKQIWFDFPEGFIPSQGCQFIAGYGGEFGTLCKFNFSSDALNCYATTQPTYYTNANGSPISVMDMEGYDKVYFGYQCK